jgi:peptidoglycan/LPS O-acetylase OafA/YrhL
MENRQSSLCTDSLPGATLSPCPSERVYSPGLNGLRFYAAISVAIGITEGGLHDLLLYSITIGGAVLLAAASYRWFESLFLRLKTRFAVVQTER